MLKGLPTFKAFKSIFDHGLNEDAILSIRYESIKIYVNPVNWLIKWAKCVISKYQTKKSQFDFNYGTK